jgi:hypothetical protein
LSCGEPSISRIQASFGIAATWPSSASVVY